LWWWGIREEGRPKTSPRMNTDYTDQERAGIFTAETRRKI
jgi:hypothetical protein